MSRLSLQNQQITHILPETGVTIYSGRLFPSNSPVTITETLFSSLLQANSALKQAFSLSSLVHSNILKVLDCYFDVKEGRYSVTVVQETGERSLEGEIREREEEGRHWTDGEVSNTLKELINALSFAEKHTFSPKNITPNCIFFTENTVKIGDFASTSQNSSQFPYEEGQISPTRSLFHSLGIAMACMCLLRAPEKLDESLSTELDQYPTVKPVILKLLQEKTEERLTFAQFQDDLDRELAVSVPEPEETLRKCLSCGQTICSEEWTASVPRHWELYKGFYAACCSRQCFEARAFRFSMVSTLRSSRPRQQKAQEEEEKGTIQVQYEAYRPEVFPSRPPMRPFGFRRGPRFPH